MTVSESYFVLHAWLYRVDKSNVAPLRRGQSVCVCVCVCVWLTGEEGKCSSEVLCLSDSYRSSCFYPG